MAGDIQEHYFRNARSCFFRWDDDGKVLAWDNGLTIAFREEIAAVMKRLAPSILPPFNAIAVLLSACRNNWADARWYLTLLCEEQSQIHHNFRFQPVGWNRDMARWLRLELDRVNALPEDLRGNLSSRCELVAMVFEESPIQTNWLSADQSLALAEQMASGLPESMESRGGLQLAINEAEAMVDESVVIEASESLPAPSSVLPGTLAYANRDAQFLMRDLDWLRNGLRNLNELALRRRLRTGLEEEVVDAREENADQSQSIIGQLMQDEELGGVARLARDIMALLTFPRKLSQPEELSLGGISDITNRGQLDKLLLSELAHDDLTLATRIALNEALYLHRESPPAARPQHRRVLIDTGLCLWGVPRVFATAVGLSMAASADENVAVDFVRPDGAELHDVDFTTREGVERHLEVITPDLHPGNSLEQFFGTRAEGEAEFVIITHEDVAEEPAFKTVLHEHLPSAACFLVTLSNTGQLTLSSVTEFGSRVVRRGQLKLDDVLDGPKKRKPLHSGEPELPLIFHQMKFPIRMFHQIDVGRGFQTDKGVVMSSPDGRLMLWNLPGSGALQLTDKLGPGRIFWCGTDNHGVPMFVFGLEAESALKLVRIHDDGYVPITNLTFDGMPRRVSGYAGKIFIEFGDRWEMFRSGKSGCIATKWKRDLTFESRPPNGIRQTPGLSASARFFKATQQGTTLWLGLSEEAGEIHFTPIVTKNPLQISHLFDRRGHGVVVVYNGGRIKRLYGDEADIKLRYKVELSAVAADGSSFVVAHPHNQFAGAQRIVTDTFERRDVHDSVASVFDNLDYDCSVQSIRKHFVGIVVAENQIYLRARKGKLLSISRRDGILLGEHENRRGFQDNSFEAMESPIGTLYRLKVATWPCGSRAVLDTRGLLHLMSCDSSVPQISLVLHEGRMSGWCESGGAFGLGYCTPDGKTTPGSYDEEIYVKAVEGFARCCDS